MKTLPRAMFLGTGRARNTVTGVVVTRKAWGNYYMRGETYRAESFDGEHIATNQDEDELAKAGVEGIFDEVWEVIE